MMFLSLEYQLFLIIELVFSSYLFINAFTLRHQSVRLRSFGLVFFLPFFLSVAAFLTAPYNKLNAQTTLLTAHIFLILLLTLSLYLNEKSESSKLFYLLPFFMTGLTLFISHSSLNSTWYTVYYLACLGFVLFHMALTVHTLFQKSKERLPAYLGLFIMASALGVWLLSGTMTLEGLFLMTVGYSTCTVYSYQNTLGRFLKDYYKNSEDLQRMNASLQTEVIRRVEQIEKSNRKLLEISKTDSMTGLYIKSAVIKKLETSLERSPRTTMSLLMFDIDNFKHINDSFGHQVGDRCIKTLASLSMTSFRKDDILGRFGGDEFIALLPDTSPTKAYGIADRFRLLVQSKSSPQLTISIGIANYPEDAKTPELLIDAADKALYISKQKGRNLVTLYASLKSNISSN